MRTPYEIQLRNGRVLRTTPVFDTYWRFASERQEMFMRRVLGSTPPWTEDPILSAHRFTNTYRASDRVSQYLIRHVIYEGSQKPEEVFFRTILFKIFNRIDTWEALRAQLGTVSWREFTFDAYAKVLDRLIGDGQRIYSAAYIMPSPAFGSPRKHRNHLRLVEHMMADGATRKLAKATSLRAVFELLRGYPSLGDFLAFQFAIDVNYSELIDFSEMEFVVAGPGARDGIRKCFKHTSELTEAEVIQVMAERADAEFERLGMRFQSLWGRSLQLIDCQNVFCEVSKYARVAHPDVEGESGRTRIKQKFTPRPAPIPQWYPPKWGITVDVPATTPNGEAGSASQRRPAHAGEVAARP
ncbi:nucleotide kinase domain-containing protein [Sorangium sp. So ce363]|uniref:nucleotide kinase domain-containing protein n=1 Tax=Sorangium sp. So ce363 TaxID=3133304 RepID=UPI003F61CF3E